MLVGGVVGDEVEDDSEVAGVGLMEEFVEIGEGAEDGVDGGVVGDVVAEVGHGRGVEGADPEGVDAEGDEVVEAGGDAGEIADAVGVCVLKTAGVDLVDDSGLPPLGGGEFAVGHRGWMRGWGKSNIKGNSLDAEGAKFNSKFRGVRRIALEDGYGAG